VEIAKNLTPPLNAQQRTVLMLLISDTGLPIQEIAKVGRRVIDVTTYSTLDFKHWKEQMEPVSFKTPKEEPDRYCEECNENHKWNELCPRTQ
jgi:hypothetical protein